MSINSNKTSAVNMKVIYDDQEAAKEVYRAILEVTDTELADKLTVVVTDALMAKYKKGLTDGTEIGRTYENS